MLTKSCKELGTAFAATERLGLREADGDHGSKFSSVATMSCGDIAAFYEGLGGRVGGARSIKYSDIRLPIDSAIVSSK